ESRKVLQSRGRLAALAGAAVGPLAIAVVAGFAASSRQVGAHQAAARATQPAHPPAPSGTLAQVMRGIYFPNSNLIFDVQQHDPAAANPKSEGTASATAVYGNAYSGWETVENAAIALTDGVDLILAPGRLCQNGKPVPTGRADFRKFAQQMRDAGRV